MLYYARQSISEDDIQAVVDVLRSDCITQGPVLPKFEQAIASKVHAKYAFGVNSATSALHLACLSLGLGPGDWLWTSPVSFVASANCGLYCGASIDFVDIDKHTGLLSIAELTSKLEKAYFAGNLPKILIPVHLAGSSCDMKSIALLAKQYGFSVIEDASHAIGGSFSGNPVGCCEFSDICIFSFHPVKIITTGEGGMAVTNNPKLANKINMLRGHGIMRDQFELNSPGPWYYEQQQLGFNYRMTEFQAALGLSQLSRIDMFINKRHDLVEVYRQAFAGNNMLEILEEPDETFSAYHLAVIRLLNVTAGQHKKLFEWMRAQEIWVQLHYWPIHLHPYYRRLGFRKGQFPCAEAYGVSSFSLPIYPKLTNDQQSYVVSTLIDGLDICI